MHTSPAVVPLSTLLILLLLFFFCNFNLSSSVDMTFINALIFHTLLGVHVCMCVT